MTPEDYQRFWGRVNVGEAHECWRFGKASSYGRFTNKAGGVAHVLVYEMTRGPKPAGWVIHHVCEHKWCVNPSHLQRMTVLGHKRHHNIRTQCKRGHSPEAYVIQGGHHQCLECQAEKRRAAGIPARKPRGQYKKRT